MKVFLSAIMLLFLISCSSSAPELKQMQKIFGQNEAFLTTEINTRLKALSFNHQLNSKKIKPWLKKGTDITQLLHTYISKINEVHSRQTIISTYQQACDSLDQIIHHMDGDIPQARLKSRQFNDFKDLSLLKSYLTQNLTIRTYQAMDLILQNINAPYCYFGPINIEVTEKSKSSNSYNFSIQSDIFKHVSDQERQIRIDSVFCNHQLTNTEVVLTPNYVLSDVKLGPLKKGTYELKGTVSIKNSPSNVFEVPFTHTFEIE